MHRSQSSLTLDRLVSRISSIPDNNNILDPKKPHIGRYNQSLCFQNNQTYISKQVRIFKKKNNLMETNKENISRQDSPKNKLSFLDNRLKETTTPSRKDFFHPKRETEIKQNHNRNDSPDQPKQCLLQHFDLEKMLRKNQFKHKRTLLGYNIPELEKKYNFSRFQLHTLYSTYKTLILNSKQSIGKFKNEFEVILNMNKVTMRPQILQKIFQQQDQLTFPKFVEMYRKIDQILFQQNIIDYIQILFEGLYNIDTIRFDDIVRIMSNRITEKESIDIANIIYEQLDRKEESTLRLKQILRLCHSSQVFSQKMFRIYTRDSRSN